MAVPAYQNFGAPYNPPNPADDPNNPNKQPAGYSQQGQTAQTGDTQAPPSGGKQSQAAPQEPQPAQPQSPTGGQTFAALQKAGIARPPIPGYGQPPAGMTQTPPQSWYAGKAAQDAQKASSTPPPGWGGTQQQWDQTRGASPTPSDPNAPTGLNYNNPGAQFQTGQPPGAAGGDASPAGMYALSPEEQAATRDVYRAAPQGATPGFNPPSFNPVNTVNPTPFGSPTNPGQPGGYTPPMTPTGNPQIPGGIPQGYTPPQSPMGVTGDPNTGQTFGGPQQDATGLEGQLYNGWQNSGTPQQFNAQGPQSQFTGQFQPSGQNNAFNNETQAAIQQAMQNPSRYDNPALQDAFKQFSGQIDDQYNGLDQGLRGSIASRGLGSIGDSSIGTADQRFQNLQRRSAKSDMASNLLNQQAQTYGSDRAQALAMAMGYGGQQFNQGLQGFGANMAANQQNFGQGQQNFQNAYNTFGANQGAQNQAFQQKQQNLGNLLGYGQQAFGNQLATNQQNQNAQDSQQAYLLKLLGYG